MTLIRSERLRCFNTQAAPNHSANMEFRVMDTSFNNILRALKSILFATLKIPEAPEVIETLFSLLVS